MSIHEKAPSKLDKLEQDTPDEGLTIEIDVSFRNSPMWPVYIINSINEN